MVIPILQVCLKLEHCRSPKATRHPTLCNIINDVKLFPTVYRRIYCSKFMMLSNQKLCYKIKHTRILFNHMDWPISWSISTEQQGLFLWPCINWPNNQYWVSYKSHSMRNPIHAICQQETLLSKCLTVILAIKIKIFKYKPFHGIIHPSTVSRVTHKKGTEISKLFCLSAHEHWSCFSNQCAECPSWSESKLCSAEDNKSMKNYPGHAKS